MLCRGKTELDDLRNCYNAYEKLLNIQYRFVLARKTKKYRITILFKWEDFFHLTGMQHLKDIPQLVISRKVLRTKIRVGEITAQDLRASMFCVTDTIDINCRIKYLSYLDQFIASENTVLDYMNKKDKGSNIKADWMITGEFNSQDCYLFIEGYNSRNRIDRINDEYYCKSFFPSLKTKYGAYATSTTILLKERLDVTANTTKTLYRHPTFSEEF